MGDQRNVSTDEDHAVDLNRRVNELESTLEDFHQVTEERDRLISEVFELNVYVEELKAEKEKLKAEHTEELAVLSSSFSEHFGKANESDDNNNAAKIKEYEKEIQKLRNTIEDKNYHINKLQNKLLRTQIEMEEELEKHEVELDELRSQLDKLENSDTESLVEERMRAIKEGYEKELDDLRVKLKSGETDKDDELSDRLKEIDELKLRLKNLEDSMDEKMEEEETKFRREVLAVKDRLIHQHRLEIDELLSQLERSNAEIDKLKLVSAQKGVDKQNSGEKSGNVPNGDIANNHDVHEAELNGSLSENSDKENVELVRVKAKDAAKFSEQLESVHAQYEQQMDRITIRLKDQYQNELDDSVHKIGEDWEQQYERQRTEYEEKMFTIQRQLRAQHQADLEQVAADMEEQIQVLKNGHAEEIAELMQRLRGLSEDRRKSYIEQDTTQQEVVVIKEEFKSKIESYEQELRAEKEKVANYERKMESVEAQVQAFKSEKEQEVKYIEEELKKQCKVLVEKKAKELKEKYQSELNEKVNKVERTLRKQYEEDVVKTRSELKESNRTLKEKYENEVSDIMIQMEQVQQRNQEVFEAQQKEQFEKQLSLVKEELAPYKGKCQELELENKELMEKYKKDLSELKSKMDEVEERYKTTDKIEEESLKNLEGELGMYKTKVQQLEEGNKMLVENYGAQLDNMKRKFEEMEEGEAKTLQEEVHIYTKRTEKLEREKVALVEIYEIEIKSLNEKMKATEADLKVKKEEFEKVGCERQELNKIVSELSKQLESYINNCAELEEAKQAMDNRHCEEVEIIKRLEKDLEEYLGKCTELEEAKINIESEHDTQARQIAEKIHQLESELKDSQDAVTELEEQNKNMEIEHDTQARQMAERIRHLESELKDSKGAVTELEEQKKNSDIKSFEDTEKLSGKLQALEKELENHRGKYLIEEEAKATMNNRHVEKVKILTGKIKDLEKGLEDYQSNCSELEEVKKAMENKYVVEVEDLKSKIEEANHLSEIKEQDLQTATKDKEKLEGELKKVVDELITSQTKNREFEFEKDSLITAHVGKITELTEKLEQMKGERAENQNEGIKRLLRENTDLKQRLVQLQDDLDVLKTSNSKLLQEKKEQYDSRNKAIAILNEKILSLEEQSERESKNLEKVKVRYELLIADLKGEMESQKGNMSELELTNSQYMQEIASLVQEVERLKSDQESNNRSETVEEEIQRYEDEIDELKNDMKQMKSHIVELEDEGHNRFGVLLSQHEKELESLKEELEEQIARKREQLAKEAGSKRQKLKEEYEGKLRIIYEELVSERNRAKDLFNQNNQLSQKVQLLEGVNAKQRKDIERVKQMEERLKEIELQAKNKNDEAESEKLVDEYNSKVESLKDNVQELREKIEARDKDVEDKAQQLGESTKKVQALEDDLKAERDEMEKLRDKLNLGEKQEVDVKALIEMYDDRVKCLEDEIRDAKSRLEERVEEFKKSIKILENVKAELHKELQGALASKEKLQQNVHNMDKAKQAVVQMYDEKIESLAHELEYANERDDSLSEKIEISEKMFRSKEKEWENKLQKLTAEKELGQQKEIIILESESDKETAISLKEQVEDLEGELGVEKEKSKRDILAKESETEKARHMLAMKENDLQNEKELNTNLKKKVDEQHVEIDSRTTKLQKMTEVVSKREREVIESEHKVRVVEEELNEEKSKSARLARELQTFIKTQSSDYLQSIERIREELKEEHDENNEKLKKNYESIFAKKEDEHRLKTEELEAEIVTLQGMVENLEQLSQLKDEEREIDLKERDEKHESSVRELQCHFEKERNELLIKVKHVEKRLLDANSEREKGLDQLQHRLSLENQTKAEEFSKQVEKLVRDRETLKESYEKEVHSLRDQVAFENSFQVELQEDHQRELKLQTETLKEKHKEEVETINSQLQQKVKELETSKTEHEDEVKCLSERLEEHKQELNTLKQTLHGKKEMEHKKLEEQLRDYAKREADYKKEVSILKSQLKEVASIGGKEKEAIDVATLRNDNIILSEEVKHLKENIQEINLVHQNGTALLKTELEMQYKQRRDMMTRTHTEELDKLMERLESLVQQENASKALTESHMLDIEGLRNEMGQKVQRLAREKQNEIESAKRAIDHQYREQQKELQDQVHCQSQELDELKTYVKSLRNKINEIVEEKKRHQQERDELKDELACIRTENAELYRKLRDQIPNMRLLPDVNTQKVDQLRAEIEALKSENENFRKITPRHSKFVTDDLEMSETSNERTRLLQLITLMEQLMKEKNVLELKLREEILDLKTKFGYLGEASNTPINYSVLSDFSPDRPLTKDAHIDMLQDLRENKRKQEEDIQAHIREIEDMINDIKKRIDSTEFTDRRIQEMLTSQLKHLEEQRRLLVSRLWKLREKHKAIEETLLRQTAGLSMQSSSGDESKSKYFENLLEENLRREKELLSLKRQQVNDLQTKLSLEKMAMERKVAERQKLKLQLREKDRQEKELSTERNELERKWVDRLREKELELKHEMACLESKKMQDQSTAARISGLISRSSVVKNRGYIRDINDEVEDRRISDYLTTASLRQPVAPYYDYKTTQFDPVRSSVSTDLKSEAFPTSSRSKSTSHVAKPTRYSKEKRQLTTNTEFSRLPNESFNPMSRVPKLDLSSDEELDIELNLPDVEDTLYWEMDFKDDSDIELYSPESVSALDGTEKDWEKNLEEELKQISAGTIKVYPGRYPLEKSREDSTAKQKRALERPGLSRSQSDLGRNTSGLNTNTLVTSSAGLGYQEKIFRKSTFDKSHESYPRSSTAIPGLEHEGSFTQNGSIDISQIPTMLPTLLKSIKRESSLTEHKSAHDSRELDYRPVLKQRDSLSSLLTKQRNRSDSKRQAQFGNYVSLSSPRSVKSEPAGKTSTQGRHPSSVQAMANTRVDLPDRTAVFLLNIDDYVDRHQVRSSFQVANLRDLSPTEERYGSAKYS